VNAPKKPTMHAKAMIVDGDTAYVGSINFTKNSIERNREIGLIFTDSVAINFLEKNFLSDAK